MKDSQKTAQKFQLKKKSKKTIKNINIRGLLKMIGFSSKTAVTAQNSLESPKSNQLPTNDDVSKNKL